MAQYVLKRVKFNRDGKKYKIGDTVDLNKREAEAMAWGIEQVGYRDPDEDDEGSMVTGRRREIPSASAESDTPSQMAAKEKGVEGSDLDADTDSDDETERDLDLTVLDGNALSVKEYINTLDDEDQLKTLRKAEASGKDRSGVINAIDARMEELAT